MIALLFGERTNAFGCDSDASINQCNELLDHQVNRVVQLLANGVLIPPRELGMTDQ